MIDIAFFVVVLLVIAAIFMRRTSAGVAILALLAGVLLDQLLSLWVLGILPMSSGEQRQYVAATVHLILILAPALVALVSVKVRKHNPVLALLASITLGFLVVFFTYKFIIILPAVPTGSQSSALLTFITPYQNYILASGAVLAVIEMSFGHKHATDEKKKKSKS